MKKSTVLRKLLASGRTIMAPGVYDGLSSRLVGLAGFEVAYASGGAIARSAAYPDIGLLSATEVFERLEKIVDASDIPVIADADTGFGGTANVQRTVRALERIGVAGFHMEDQAFPKRCGHLNDKSLIGAGDMCQKIKVARASLEDADCLVIARTDAIAIEGFEAALSRAERYIAAGADMIFVEAPETLEQIEMIAQRIPGSKLINMFYGGKTPLVPLQDLESMGYHVVLVPSDLQRAAIHAMKNVLAELARSGDSHALSASLTSFSERELIVRTEQFLALDK